MGKSSRLRRQKKDKQRQRRMDAAASRGASAKPGAARATGPRPRPASGPQREAFSAPDQRGLAAAAIADALRALCDGKREEYDSYLDVLRADGVPSWRRTVSRSLVEYLRSAVSGAWRCGWQPAEVARQVGRELTAQHAAVAAAMIVDEMGSYAAASVDSRWAAQVAALEAAAPGQGRWWGSDADFLAAWHERCGSGEFRETVAVVVETLHQFHHLPALERLLPLPGAHAHQAASVPSSSADVDDRLLGRIRALLAKAESTEYVEEAEALSARAQGLMAKYSIDHALLAAGSAGKEAPGGRRVAVDNPYEAPKVSLLQAVALANRCRVVWFKQLGLVTVVGFPADLDVVEMLFTSLLVQASSAMLRAGTKRDSWGQSRTRSFRQSFLVSYAIRIGERLAEAAGHAEREAVAEQRAAASQGPVVGGGAAGTDLVPFLAARQRAVDDAVNQMFGDTLTHRGSARATNMEGWTFGRAAADLATLSIRTSVTGS